MIIKNITLSTSNVSRIFERVAVLNNRMIVEGRLVEGPMWDKIKSGAKSLATNAGQKLSQVGKSVTSRVTADQLMTAWKAAGSPTQAEAVAQFLKQAGISGQVIDTVYRANNLNYAKPSLVPKTTTQPTVQPTVQTPEPVAPAGRTKQEVEALLAAIKAERRTRLLAQNQQAYQDALKAKTVKKKPIKKSVTKPTVKTPVAKSPTIKVGGQAIDQADPKYANIVKQAQTQAPVDVTNQPIKIGGQEIDPNDPKYAPLLKKLKTNPPA